MSSQRARARTAMAHVVVDVVEDDDDAEDDTVVDDAIVRRKPEVWAMYGVRTLAERTAGPAYNTEEPLQSAVVAWSEFHRAMRVRTLGRRRIVSGVAAADWVPVHSASTGNAYARGALRAAHPLDGRIAVYEWAPGFAEHAAAHDTDEFAHTPAFGDDVDDASARCFLADGDAAKAARMCSPFVRGFPDAALARGEPDDDSLVFATVQCAYERGGAVAQTSGADVVRVAFRAAAPIETGLSGSRVAARVVVDILFAELECVRRGGGGTERRASVLVPACLEVSREGLAGATLSLPGVPPFAFTLGPVPADVLPSDAPERAACVTFYARRSAAMTGFKPRPLPGSSGKV